MSHAGKGKPRRGPNSSWQQRPNTATCFLCKTLPLLGSLAPAPRRPILIIQTSTQASLRPRLAPGSRPVRLQTPSCPFIAFLGTHTVLGTQPLQC